MPSGQPGSLCPLPRPHPLLPCRAFPTQVGFRGLHYPSSCQPEPSCNHSSERYVLLVFTALYMALHLGKVHPGTLLYPNRLLVGVKLVQLLSIVSSPTQHTP